jgi:hypothetical protein
MRYATRPEDVAVVPSKEHDAPDVESFDRLAFAASALELVRPARMTVALCGRSARLRVEAGRKWGCDRGERWALVSVPETASRRAIALAIAELTDGESRPYALDVLIAAADGSKTTKRQGGSRL